MLRNYIGLGCSRHDPAIAILDSNGRLVFAEGMERYLQDKRAWNAAPDHVLRMPELLREYCEPGAELVVAKTWRSDSLRAWAEGLREGQIRGSFWTEWAVPQMLSVTENASRNLAFLLSRSGRRTAGAREYDHHLTHAAVACYTSPFEEATCVVVDGLGEQTSLTIYRYVDGEIAEVSERPSEGSIAGFYMLLCEACGFSSLKGEEWKVMGLAPYGRFSPELYDLMRPIVRVEGLALEWAPDARERLEKLRQRTRPAKSSPLEAADLAFTGQQVFCDVSEELLKRVHERYPSQNLVYGGGAALNSAWNGQITSRTPFAQLHVFSAPADDGNAAGAAWLAYFADHPERRRDRAATRAAVQSPYLGSRMDPDTLRRAVELGGLKVAAEGRDHVLRRSAELLAEDRIVGWIQGRAEFGPRALGNRSILANPKSSNIKDRLNARVKFREEYRPLAPSILHEYGREYFVDYEESPYMERALRFKSEVCDRVPGVVHVDSTGRLQTVKREWNERYYDLIETFRQLSGVPMVLNTSFNVMGKPISHSVEDALAVFFTTGLDALAIDDLLFEKSKP